MNSKQKAINKANQLINKAIQERDTKGYRENLGYDLYGNLANYMNKLDLNYPAQCEVNKYFNDRCDAI